MSAAFNPDRIFIIIRFKAITAKENSNVQNDSRRILMDLPKASKPLPKEVAKIVEQDVLSPYQFALVKEPTKVEDVKGRKRGGLINIATGAIASYFYTGPWEKLEKTQEAIKQVCDLISKTVNSVKWSSFEVYVAKEV